MGCKISKYYFRFYRCCCYWCFRLLRLSNFVSEPKAKEAVSELNQAQYYFELAVNSVNSDSLYRRALNGGEGKYGFLDIIENYKGTSAANLLLTVQGWPI